MKDRACVDVCPVQCIYEFDAQKNMLFSDLVRDWRADLSTETYVSASRVQDRLLALWGDVGERGTGVLEPWRALTTHRNLFTAAELLALLDEIEATIEVSGPDLVGAAG